MRGHVQPTSRSGGTLTTQTNTNQTPVTVIEPTPGWRIIDFRELYEYRDLFRFLTYKAIRTRYAQSALGLSWAIIQPVVTTLVFTLVFGKMVKVESDGASYFLFNFTAMTLWTYFSSALTEAVSTLIAEQNMVSKIYFPRLILPMSRILARLLDFIVAFIILAGLLLWYRQMPNWGVAMLPLLTLMMVFAASGLGMFLSAMAVQYRDVSYAMTFVVRLLMYAAPVVYPTSLVPEWFRPYYAINPMVGVIEGFRSALLGTIPMPWDLIGIGAVSSVVLLLFGAAYFRRKERIFADVA